MPLRVEFLDLEQENPNKEFKPYDPAPQVEPGQAIVLSIFHIKVYPLGGEHIEGMAAFRATCAEDDQSSGIVEFARNNTGSVSESWDLLFNPKPPTLDRILGPNESHAINGYIPFGEEIESIKGILRFTHFLPVDQQTKTS